MAMAKAKELPDDLIRDIVALLPDMKNLHRFKSISKPYYSIIIEEIKRREPKLIILNNRTNYTFYFEDLNSPDCLEEHHFPDGILDGSTVILRGSCNGLILFTTYFSIILWNKVLRDYQVITQRPEYIIPKSYSIARKFLLYGFGYDPGNDDYKVVEIMCFYRGENGPIGHVTSMRVGLTLQKQCSLAMPYIGWHIGITCTKHPFLSLLLTSPLRSFIRFRC
ncbi:hypothetical protein SLA2020_110990 [Shorea laevis]